MKRTFVVIIGSLLCGMSFAQTTSVGDHLTIRFPSTPDMQQAGNKTIYTIVDSGYVIYVVVADMQANTKFRIEPDQLGEFYRGVIIGTLNAGADSKLIDETTIKLGAYEGRQIRYTKDFDGMDGIPITKWILLVNKSVYTFDIWDLSKEGQKNLEQQIFESITVQ